MLFRPADIALLCELHDQDMGKSDCWSFVKPSRLFYKLSRTSLQKSKYVEIANVEFHGNIICDW